MNQRSILLSILASAALISGSSAYLASHLPLIWQISGGVSLFALGVFISKDYPMLVEIFSRKTTRYGLNSVLMSILFLAIMVVINLIAVEHDWKRDFTKNKIHTLSDESIKILKGLKDEIVMRAFVYPTQTQDYDAMFDKFTYHTKLLKKEYVDLDKEPMAVKTYNVKQAGTVIFESQARTSRVENLMGSDDPKAEEKITNAIIQVAKGEKKKAYFISGHGERLVSESGREGYSEVKETLENSRYKVEELVLLDKEGMPPDADIVICAGPKADFMERELKLLEGYVLRGGHLMMLVEPNSPVSLKAFLAKFGADWKQKKTILETNPLQQMAGGNPLTPIVTVYDAGHDITRETRQLSIFPIASPVEKSATPPKDMTVTSLFSTSSRSLEVELQGDKVKIDQKTDRKGPLSLAVAISGKASQKKDEKQEAKKTVVGSKAEPEKTEGTEENKDSEFRMVVVGDADFASNSAKRFGVNSDLFQNMLSWLSKEEDLISIRPRSAEGGVLEVTEFRVRAIHACSVLFAPLVMFGLGMFVWIRRRRL